jgi:hypothetical protein
MQSGYDGGVPSGFTASALHLGDEQEKEAPHDVISILLLCPMSEYFPQNPGHGHPKSVLYLYGERSCFTPMQTDIQNYGFVHFNLDVFS